MATHFLLSNKARTLSLSAILRMTDDEAHDRFVAIRFAANGGAPYCPRCECTAVYTYAARKIWKCKRCNHQFSVTSGTIFASRKLPIRDYLAARAAGRGCLDHAHPDVRQHQRPIDHDRGEGGGDGFAGRGGLTPNRVYYRQCPALRTRHRSRGTVR